LHKKDRTKEFFFVIDNTEYPEALRQTNWKAPKHIMSDGSKDIKVDVSFSMKYTSNDKY